MKHLKKKLLNETVEILNERQMKMIVGGSCYVYCHDTGKETRAPSCYESSNPCGASSYSCTCGA